MQNLEPLLLAARAVSPDCEVKFRGTKEDDRWVCLVCVGAATIFESKPGRIEEVIEEASRKLKGVSQKMQKALDDPSKKAAT
jgi:hypothetical protein